MHVLVEKPMCYSVAEGAEMLDAAGDSGVLLMVGYPKRHDPAYRRVVEEVARPQGSPVRRVSRRWKPLPSLMCALPGSAATTSTRSGQRWRADSGRRVATAIGLSKANERRMCYETVLLDTIVHEFNLLRGMLGEPTAVTFASLRGGRRPSCWSSAASSASLRGSICPASPSYEMEVCVYDPAERVRLAFGSPT